MRAVLDSLRAAVALLFADRVLIAVGALLALLECLVVCGGVCYWLASVCSSWFLCLVWFLGFVYARFVYRRGWCGEFSEHALSFEKRFYGFFYVATTRSCYEVVVACESEVRANGFLFAKRFFCELVITWCSDNDEGSACGLFACRCEVVGWLVGGLLLHPRNDIGSVYDVLSGVCDDTVLDASFLDEWLACCYEC